MTITDRDRRALILLGMAVAVVAIYVGTSSKESSAAVVPAVGSESIPLAEQRLIRMRQSVARVAGREEVLKLATAELAQREKGLVEAETAPQATEQLLGIVRKLAGARGITLRSTELGQPAPYADAYGQVSVAVTTECHIEDLVNLLADLSARRELIATNDLRIGAANASEKTVSARLNVAALIPRRLVPKKKEGF